MSETNKKQGLLTANGLKIIAMLAMLIDHLWATLISGNQWMNFVGRLAFPIFAFQIAEGFKHTHNFKKYALRLLILAFLSEIPFNLMVSGSIFFPFHQNTVFTLLLGLIAIWGIDKYRTNKSGKSLFIALSVPLVAALAATIGFTDYGGLGVFTVVAFHLADSTTYKRLFQALSMVILHVFLFSGMYIPLEIFGRIFEFHTQGFAVLALIPIWLSNGAKGGLTPLTRYAMYIFYPLHLIVLYLVRIAV